MKRYIAMAWNRAHGAVGIPLLEDIALVVILFLIFTAGVTELGFRFDIAALIVLLSFLYYVRSQK